MARGVLASVREVGVVGVLLSRLSLPPPSLLLVLVLVLLAVLVLVPDMGLWKWMWTTLRCSEQSSAPSINHWLQHIHFFLLFKHVA
jgi:hypothetical protein